MYRARRLPETEVAPVKHLIPLVILAEQQVVFLVIMNLTVLSRYMDLNHLHAKCI